MIILDTCVLRNVSLHDSGMDLLRTIRSARVQEISLPWLALEELAAQKALKHRDAHEAVVQKFEALRRATPWGVGEPPALDMERVREHCREEYTSVFGVVPTGEHTAREALRREANGEAPCKVSHRQNGKKTEKSGARDAAIWLSAIDYARQHPQETVYFVSSNTNDFGPPHRSAMAEDVADLGERFVHLKSLDEVVDRFATRVTGTNEAVVATAAELDESRHSVARAAVRLKNFACSVARAPGEAPAVATDRQWWGPPSVDLGSVDAVETFDIAGRKWCTATVRWVLTGATCGYDGTSFHAASSWATRVLVSLDMDVPSLEILRTVAAPGPLSEAELGQVDLYDLLQASVASIPQFFTEPQHAYVRVPHKLRLHKIWHDVLMDAAAEYEDEEEEPPYEL